MALKNVKPGAVVHIVQIALLVIIAGLLVWSKPWDGGGASNQRKVTVSGEAVVEAEPDSYQFTPTYEKSGTDRATVLGELTPRTNEIVIKLIELGVKQEDINLQSSAYNQEWLQTTEPQTAVVYFTINVDNKDLAQKVQDYLLTTSPGGSISPHPTFSDEKRKTLETEAREKAIADARAKAEASANELGVSLGKVLEVKDGFSNGGVMPLAERGSAATDASLSLPILSGKQEVRVTVEVSFAVK